MIVYFLYDTRTNRYITSKVKRCFLTEKQAKAGRTQALHGDFWLTEVRKYTMDKYREETGAERWGDEGWRLVRTMTDYANDMMWDQRREEIRIRKIDLSKIPAQFWDDDELIFGFPEPIEINPIELIPGEIPFPKRNSRTYTNDPTVASAGL